MILITYITLSLEDSGNPDNEFELIITNTDDGSFVGGFTWQGGIDSPLRVWLALELRVIGMLNEIDIEVLFNNEIEYSLDVEVV